MARPKWSKIGFILAAIGSAIGLGNIWRFPYIVGENGGGAFLIPYFIGVIIFGIPVLLLEFSVGRKFRGSVITTFRKINPKIKHLGLIPVIVLTGVLSYYTVIMGWTLSYSVSSLFGTIDFHSFTSSVMPLFSFISVIAIITTVVGLGIKKGIEKTCKMFMPLLFLFIIILLIKSFSLPGLSQGISFYLKPNLEALSHPTIWMIAFSQAFFSLSAGLGIMLTYGSYLSKETDITKSALKIASADTLIAIAAGLIIFPIVFSFGLSPGSGPELAFVTLPKVFSNMVFGNIFATMFFFVLFIGALTSAISMLEVVVSTIIDELKTSRKKATFFSSMIIFILGLPSALSYSGLDLQLLGMKFLDAIDHIFGSVLMPFATAVLCIFLGWFWDLDNIFKEIDSTHKNKKAHHRIMIIMIKYVIPIVLLSLFVFELIG